MTLTESASPASTERTADTAVPIVRELDTRWSPRSFDATATVSDQQLDALLEAARWAPSGSNQQPRRFIVARRGTHAFDIIVDSLVGFNAAWAVNASALVVAIAETSTVEGEKRPYVAYDLGQAVAHLSVQAHAEVLHERDGVLHLVDARDHGRDERPGGSHERRHHGGDRRDPRDAAVPGAGGDHEHHDRDHQRHPDAESDEGHGHVQLADGRRVGRADEPEHGQQDDDHDHEHHDQTGDGGRVRGPQTATEERAGHAGAHRAAPRTATSSVGWTAAFCAAWDPRVESVMAAPVG
ncbi:nitroreductase family protein [Clavibacter sepedonicus]|uniref:nitroreductase family protein n=1 Tax=Clavibacter sepedonicus TaxID=31964 RepID=UPI003DA2576C